MIKNIKISLSIIAGIALFSSCNKFLDMEPDNRTKIDNVSKVSQLLGSAYPRTDYYFAETASDNVQDRGFGAWTVADIYTAPFLWLDNAATSTGTPTNYWNSCYKAISAANFALEAIEKENMGPSANPYKGEALVARAYAHHMLAIFFAKNYVIGGANDSPGIPYVTKPGEKVFEQYTRGTVASTYANILKDLEEGLPLLSQTAYAQPKFHFTPVAAHAFAARLYLFLGKWNEVVSHASQTVTGGDFINYLRPINTTFYALNDDNFIDNFSKSDVKSSLLITNSVSNWTINTNKRYGISTEAPLMYTLANVTGGRLANRIVFFSNVKYSTWKWRTTDFSSSTFMQSLFTVDEAILNRAEANAELGNYQLALDDLNTFYSTKNLSYSPANHTVTLAKIASYFGDADPKSGLVKAVLAAKKAEFLDEGMRWIDIVRRNLTVQHAILDVDNNATFIELTPNDPRRLFQLPITVSLAGVELNPR